LEEGAVKWRCSILVVIGIGLFVTSTRASAATEIKVFTVRAGATVLDKIRPDFEHATGHTLNVVYDPVIGSYAKRITAGEPFDVYITAPAGIDGLIKDGKILAETRTDLFHSGMGVEIRAGAPKPDIGTVGAFKRALLDAKSIGYITPNRVQELIDRLGLTDAVRQKVRAPNSDIVSELVANGELELGIVVTTQILTTPGVQLVGPLPPEIQYNFQFTAGVSADSKAPDAARDLIKFLTGTFAVPVIKSQGMDPG
jgi:molybdate transport system substrate-binding protein